MDVGVGFADRAAVVVAVSFLRISGFFISAELLSICYELLSKPNIFSLFPDLSTGGSNTYKVFNLSNLT